MSRFGLSTKDNESLVSKMLPLVQDGSTANMGGTVPLYLNPGQLLAYEMMCRNMTLECGRGFGKTTLMALYVNNVVYTLPRSLNLLLGASQKSVMGKITPALIKTMEQMLGLVEGIDFVRGRPSPKLKFDSPMHKPRTFENAIVFANGATWLQISLMSRANANGLTVQAIAGDECRFYPWHTLGDVMPALRPEGMVSYSGWNENTNPYYLSTFFCTDAAVSQAQAGYKIRKEQQTTDLNYEIADWLRDKNDAPELADESTAIGRRFIANLNKMRCKASLFLHFSSLENVEILGEDYFHRMKRDIPPLIYDIQVLGKELPDSHDGFYYNFDEQTHCYLTNGDADSDLINHRFNAKYKRDAYDKKSAITRHIEYDAPDLDALEKVDDCRLDSDLRMELPLHIAFDWGHDLNVAVVGQQYTMDGVDSLVILKTFFVKDNEKLETLCRRIVDYYRYKMNNGNKEIILYTDATFRQGKASALEIQESTQYDKVIEFELSGGKRKNGFKVSVKDIGQPMPHEGRYRFINSVYGGTSRFMVRINREENDFLIAALNAARVTRTEKGIKKDKSKEKLKSELGKGGRREKRTDVTDAHDLLICGVRFKGNMRMAGLSGLLFTGPRVM